MERLQQLLSSLGGGGGGPAPDAPLPDTAEKVQISSLSLLKMLKHGAHTIICIFVHTWSYCWALVFSLFIYCYTRFLFAGRAGVPLEVMGLMLGQFVDEYTITCVDVFAMPQHGTGVSVEAVDPVFQQKMLDMLKQTGR